MRFFKLGTVPGSLSNLQPGPSPPWPPSHSLGLCSPSPLPTYLLGGVIGDQRKELPHQAGTLPLGLPSGATLVPWLSLSLEVPIASPVK